MKMTGLLFVLLLLAISLFAFLKPNEFRRALFKAQQTKSRNYCAEFKPDKSSIWGIDISHHQKNVDWVELKYSKPHFIFLKATEGCSHRDTKYKEYKEKAEDQSIIVGAYHFFSYCSSGKRQAENFIRFAKLNKGNLPPVLDAEFNWNMPPKYMVQRELMAFINHVEKKTGEKPIIYCDRDYYYKYLKSELEGDYPLWICDYYRQPNCNYTFWQRTDKFRHPAFKGSVDYNTFKGSLQQLNELTIK